MRERYFFIFILSLLRTPVYGVYHLFLLYLRVYPCTPMLSLEYGTGP